MVTRKRNPLPKVTYLERVDDARRAEIDAFAETVGVKIKNHDLINRALSHKSFTNELGFSHNEQYEKLEFFGDGVLGLIVNEYLFKAFPDCEEGELAKIKSAVVSEVTLAEVAREMNLGTVILIGRGETRSGGVERPSLLADILEAFIGAVYMDEGLPAARRFVLRYIEAHIRAMSTDESVGDSKSYLQETIQKERGVRPAYTVMRSTGPDHSRIFRVSVSAQGKRLGTGTGKSKKEAEQSAAENALATLDEIKKNGGALPQRQERPERSARSARPRGASGAGRSGRSGRGGRGSRRPRNGDAPRDISLEAGAEASQGTEAGASEIAEQASPSPSAEREQTSRNSGRQRGRGRGRSRPQKDHTQTIQAKKPRDQADSVAPSSRRQHDPRARSRVRREREPEHGAFVPPKDVHDPVAWAAGESYVSRRPQGQTPNPGSGK